MNQQPPRNRPEGSLSRISGLALASVLLLGIAACSGDDALPTPPASNTPTVEILSPAPGATETGDVVTMTCVVSENTERISYSVNGGAGVEVEFSSLEYSFPLQGLVEGENSVELTVTSTSGVQQKSLLGLIWLPGGGRGSAPIANDDTATTTVNREVTIDLTANDTDADGDRLNASAGSVAPEHGTLEFLKNGFEGSRVFGVKYIPEADFIGTDTFSYIVKDSKGLTGGQSDGSDEATVTVTVTPVEPGEPEEPVEPLGYDAVDDVASTTPNREVDINVLNNDIAPESATLSISEGELEPEHGRIIFLKDGFQGGIQVAVKYLPNADFVGTDRFSYLLNGGDEATVTVNVRNVGAN